jgi:hypothetical protein
MDRLPKDRKNGDIPHVPMEIQFLSGALAGVFSWTVCYPMDVLKTEMQSQFFGDRSKISVVSCVKKFAKPQNRHLLYKGIGPCLLGSVPSSGVTFLVYETLVSRANKLILAE